MGNLSYCRFRNTLQDLHDCFEAMEGPENELDKDELKAKNHIITLCKRITEAYGDNNKPEEGGQ